ncbi:MAG: M1 family aminopeptidase [Acidobacteriota bacterium]
MSSFLTRTAVAGLMTLLACDAIAFSATHYALELEPDFEGRSLEARARITLQAGTEPASVLTLSSRRLQITSARWGRDVLELEKTAGGWSAPLTRAQARASQAVLEVSYKAGPSPGLVFGKDHVYTAFHTCHWLPCLESDLSRASIEIRLVLPAGFRSVASGRRLPSTNPGKRPDPHSWHQPSPYPLYTLGFAAGRFIEVMDTADPRLRYLGLAQDPQILRTKFRDSARMLAWFEDKAGSPLPHPVYTQVLVPGAVAQEASSFSLIGARYLDPILDNPQEDWIIAHEMAHQWWGNQITCASWSELWLNEAIAVFMTAAWKQHRWGEAAYRRELGLFEKSWQAATEAGFDKPLSWTGSYPSLRIKRAIHYSKGALFFHALREALGETVFWQGLRHFSTTQLGKTVRARDLQVAMEAKAGRSLQPLFEAWVYPERPAP